MYSPSKWDSRFCVLSPLCIRACMRVAVSVCGRERRADRAEAVRVLKTCCVLALYSGVYVCVRKIASVAMDMPERRHALTALPCRVRPQGPSEMLGEALKPTPRPSSPASQPSRATYPWKTWHLLTCRGPGRVRGLGGMTLLCHTGSKDGRPVCLGSEHLVNTFFLWSHMYF